jgi:hypothetical protein
MLRILSLALVLVFVPAAAAATARERQTPGPIEAVSIAGTEVGYADKYKGGCHEVRLWNVATRADRRLATHCFESSSTGSGVADVSVSGGRAVWITYTGGNIREWSLWTKRGTVPAKRLAFLPADVDGRRFSSAARGRGRCPMRPAARSSSSIRTERADSRSSPPTAWFP